VVFEDSGHGDDDKMRGESPSLNIARLAFCVLHAIHGESSLASVCEFVSSVRIESSRVEILNDGGYRSDGRRQFELREVTINLAQQGHADGSAIITHGLTQVLVSVFGPREAKMRSQAIHDRANINVDVNVAAFSAGERRKRSRGDKQVFFFFKV
jgi:polyribonucleotide nucleotidyltransferase